MVAGRAGCAGLLASLPFLSACNCDLSTPRATAHPPLAQPQIKSYLSGNPPIRLGLSENLILGRRDARAYSSLSSDSGACLGSLMGLGCCSGPGASATRTPTRRSAQTRVSMPDWGGWSAAVGLALRWCDTRACAPLGPRQRCALGGSGPEGRRPRVPLAPTAASRSSVRSHRAASAALCPPAARRRGGAGQPQQPSSLPIQVPDWPYQPSPPSPPAADAVVLDSHSIHEGVDAARFDAERVLELVPPEGQFALMNYRCAALPVRVFG